MHFWNLKRKCKKGAQITCKGDIKTYKGVQMTLEGVMKVWYCVWCQKEELIILALTPMYYVTPKK